MDRLFDDLHNDAWIIDIRTSANGANVKLTCCAGARGRMLFEGKDIYDAMLQAWGWWRETGGLK